MPGRSTRFILKLGVALVGLLVLVVVGLVVYAIHERHAYRDMRDSHDLKTRTAKLANQYVAKRPNAALVIGVLQHGWSFEAGFGRIADTNAAPPDGQTLFEIGSITKVFTGITLARMAQGGVPLAPGHSAPVALDDPIGRYLPAGVSAPQKNGREITLRNLATHTSGLPRLPDNFDAVSKDEQNPYVSYYATNLYQDLAAVKLAHEPGKTSDYSNYGFGLLGHLLALRAGKPYEDLVKEAVCIPIGLTNTAITLSAGQRERLTPGHDEKGKVVPNWDMDVFAPAGALRSNADDLLRFLAANLEATDAALAEAQASHFKEFGGGVGLGWQITQCLEGPTVHWHNGGTGGYVSFIGFDKNAKVAVVLLSNYGDAWSGNDDLDNMGMKLLIWAGKLSWE
jgi:serine-type D-Ala-D-Ala carboxypeptidase/endopeptidase